MSQAYPPFVVRTYCCQRFQFLYEAGLVEAHLVRYSASDLVHVHVLIGFRTTTEFLRFRRNQHVFECPFCGRALQGVVNTSVRDVKEDYVGAVRLGDNPVTGTPTCFTDEQLETALLEAAAAVQSSPRSRGKRRKGVAQKPK